MGEQRVSVKEAAILLGTTEHAIRQRIYRGTLDSEKVGGKVYVQLTETELHGDARRDTREMHDETHSRDELVEELRATNEFMRQQLEAERQASGELRRIIAAMTSRLPELESSSEPRDTTETAAEGDAPPEQGEQPRPSWWRRWFGME